MKKEKHAVHPTNATVVDRDVLHCGCPRNAGTVFCQLPNFACST